jgi:hypothetical protein
MEQAGRLLVPGDRVEYHGALFQVERAQALPLLPCV